MTARRLEARRIPGGRRARAAIAVLLVSGASCRDEPEKPGSPPPDMRGGVVELRTTGRGYVDLESSNFGWFGGCKYECDLAIPPGESVTLTPRPNTCFRFVRWTGVCAGQYVCTLSSGGETTAVFTTDPSGGEWDVFTELPPASPPPFDVPGYAMTEITHSPYGKFFPYALDESGNALGRVMNCGDRPGRYDAATGTHSILTPVPDADAVAIATASDGTVLVRGGNRSYRWKDGVLESLGSLGGYYTAATAMNAAGWAVGAAEVPPGTYPHAFLHDGTQMKDLGLGEPHAVNDAGEIVGKYAGIAALFGPPTTLLPIPSRSVPLDLSNTGIVVGSTYAPGQKSPPTAFVYDLRSGSLTTIAPLPDDLWIKLERVNPSGTLAVGQSSNREGTRSVVWSDGHLHDASTYLGVVGGNPNEVFALDVNDRGQFLIAYDWVRYFILTPR